MKLQLVIVVIFIQIILSKQVKLEGHVNNEFTP